LTKVVIGTRGSTLAMIQARMVMDALQQEAPGNSYELKTIKTTGDLITDIPLEKIGDKGLFIKELENALLSGEIDMAVHSMKDMPTELPGGLVIGAVMAREVPWDVVITGSEKTKLADMKSGTKIGSSSLRRRAQLLHHYPQLDIQSIRGNLDTRLKKLHQGDFDAIILAYAGVKRMGWAGLITETINGEICLPAVGQGAIGIEIRHNDGDLAKIVSDLNCWETEAAVKAERAFLNRLEGGCQVPVGALAEIECGVLVLEGMVASLDGSKLFRKTDKGETKDAKLIGTRLAERLLDLGCGEILELIRQECEQ
jgi:hydroxymethylbilane synthase